MGGRTPALAVTSDQDGSCRADEIVTRAAVRARTATARFERTGDVGTVGVPDAWSDLATQDEFKRSRRVGRVWLVIAVVLFSGFSVYATRLQDHADALVAHGVRTRGVVLEDPPEAIRCGQVPVPVAFDVDGQYQVHTYYVDGCGSGGLSKNKRVAVSYDRADPNDFVVNGNQTRSRCQPCSQSSRWSLPASSVAVGQYALDGCTCFGARCTRPRGRIRQSALHR